MKTTRPGLAAAALIAALGCIEPLDRRPGTWLSGDVVTEFPADWSFTDQQREIAIEVRTPYLLPHSVTIWCGSLDGVLYVGAREPDTKRWPGWVERDPEVRLGIGGQIYEGRLARVDDPDRVERVRSAYSAKYELPDPPREGSPPIRYWRVDPRS